jgi:Reverse transcriptase (RNA-dependent DNA polymerase)
VPPPPNSHFIRYKWIFKVKKKSDGTIQQYKVCLVTKGYNQEEGLDYFKSYSPLVKPITIRVVMTITLSHGWSLRQLNINNVFLHGDLKETIYMHQA